MATATHSSRRMRDATTFTNPRVSARRDARLRAFERPFDEKVGASRDRVAREPSRRPSDGSRPSTDHSRYDLEPQDQVAGGRWLLHVGGSRGLLPGLESATAKISGSARSGVPPDMSTWRIPSGVARGAAQPEHDMARPALQHHPTPVSYTHLTLPTKRIV